MDDNNYTRFDLAMVLRDFMLKLIIYLLQETFMEYGVLCSMRFPRHYSDLLFVGVTTDDNTQRLEPVPNKYRRIFKGMTA